MTSRLAFRVLPSSRPDKKYMAVFDDGYTVHFGAAGYKNYIEYSKVDKNLANRKRSQYLARHGASKENWSDLRTAGALSRWLLWEERTFDQALESLKSRVTASGNRIR